MSQLKIYDLASGTWKYVSSPSQMVAVSDSAPPSPNNGDLWWDTDDASLLVDTVAPSTLANDPAFTSRYAPYSAAWGKVFYAQTATNVTGIGAGQLLYTALNTTGLWTAVAARRYRITFQCEIIQTVASDVWVMNLIDQGVPANLNRVTGTNGATASKTLTFVYVTNASISGPKDYRIGLNRAIGTGTLDMNGSSAAAFLLIEDIGAFP